MAEPVGTKRSSRSTSKAIPVQLLAPPAVSNAPSAQVSEPNPPTSGRLLNRQTGSPLIAL
ncbi:MAG: hypothetical protein CME12_06035 [Gemmatimonadetes bacterium]|nr:hypothetical protein [Gemmatimonadota bacterium]